MLFLVIYGCKINKKNCCWEKALWSGPSWYWFFFSYLLASSKFRDSSCLAISELFSAFQNYVHSLPVYSALLHVSSCMLLLLLLFFCKILLINPIIVCFYKELVVSFDLGHSKSERSWWLVLCQIFAVHCVL